MSELRLVIFDVDGTLVDSQRDILAAMAVAFGSQGLETPARERVLSGVGLSLPETFLRLAGEQGADIRARIVDIKAGVADHHRTAPRAARSTRVHAKRSIAWRASLTRFWPWPPASRGAGSIG